MEKEDVDICIMGYYSAIKKNKILPFVATWMDLEGIMLSEISHRRTNTVCYHLYVESKKYNKLVNISKKEADSDTENKLVVSRGAVGRGNIGVKEWEVQTRLQGYIVQHGGYSQYFVITINGV